MCTNGKKEVTEKTANHYDVRGVGGGGQQRKPQLFAFKTIRKILNNDVIEI